MNLPFFLARGPAKELNMTLGLPRPSRDKSAAVPYTEEQLKSTFRRFDTNRDGRFSKQELKDAFASMGSRLPGLRAFLALHHADQNGDGYISEDELDKLVKYACKHGYTIK